MADDRTAEGTPAYPALGVAAKGIVLRDDGALLLIKRAPGSTDPECWDLPGGKMGYGEWLADALVREIREETGLTVAPTQALHGSHFTKEPFWVTCITFLCPASEGEVRLSDEHVEHAWVTLNDLPDGPYARAIREQLDAYAAFAAREPTPERGSPR
jgi:8-oxo-dGTP diphosphatase